ncbi:MAG: N-glycosylase/DNA lyase [Pseudomonadota bacterium]
MSKEIENNKKTLLKEYAEIKSLIKKRIKEFKLAFFKGEDEKLFSELVFCIFTPQSKAKNCWQTVERLVKKDLLFKGNAKILASHMNYVRFRNNKANYVVAARELFKVNKENNLRNTILSFDDTFSLRNWLVDNVKGYGYKEASHFLRNIGYGDKLAILDRHILKNLKLFGVINEIPRTITKKVYYEIETKMLSFSKELNIPADHLDLLFWYKEAGEVFK